MASTVANTSISEATIRSSGRLRAVTYAPVRFSNFSAPKGPAGGWLRDETRARGAAISVTDFFCLRLMQAAGGGDDGLQVSLAFIRAGRCGDAIGGRGGTDRFARFRGISPQAGLNQKIILFQRGCGLAGRSLADFG